MVDREVLEVESSLDGHDQKRSGIVMRCGSP